MSDSAPAQSVAEKPSRGSLIQMAVAVGLAALAGAAFEMLRPSPASAPDKPPEASSGPAAAPSTVLDLAPIVTNLGAPPDIWVRFEGSIIFDPKTMPHPEAVAGQISDDILAYLRTASLHQLEGPIGLQSIRQDLNERAATRSGGKVRALVIKTLVVQ
jgi:flagellar protein FliL